MNNLSSSGLNELTVIRDVIPVAMYITDLTDSGNFLFTSAMLDQLLGYSSQELQGTARARSLYDIEAERDFWLQSLTDDQPFELETRFRRKDHTLVPVRDIARRVLYDGQAVAIGVLQDRTKEEEAQLLRDQFQQILDHEWQNLGVHIVNSKGQLEWMNNREMRLLSDGEEMTAQLSGWVRSMPEAAHLSATDALSFSDAEGRILQKLKLDTNSEEAIRKLTKKEHRTFVVPPNLPIDSRSEAKTVAVNIDDHPIRDVRKDVGLSRLVTVVREESVPDSIKSRLLHIGARNPLLSRAQVFSFIKMLRSAARRLDPAIAEGNENDFVFLWANTVFEEELIKQGRIERRGINEYRGRYYGKKESDLYPEEKLRTAFTKADKRVLGLRPRESDDRIEDHPTESAHSTGTASVQVLKSPVFLRREDFPEDLPETDLPNLNRAQGVFGFFWYTSNTAVTEQLNSLFQPWSLLDDLEHPAATKDEDGRFTYANEAFCVDNGKRLDEVIGYTDRDLFDADLAERYEKDDKAVRRSGKQIFQREPHGTSDNPDRYVMVVKIPVRLGTSEDSRKGIHFIYWADDGDPDEDSRETPEGDAAHSWIDYKLRQLNYRGVPYEMKTYHHASAILLEFLIQNRKSDYAKEDLIRIVEETRASDSTDISGHIKRAKEILNGLSAVSEDDEVPRLTITRGPKYRIIDQDD